MALNTLAQPGGYQPDGAAYTTEAGAGTLEGPEAKGSLVHSAAPHLRPASK